MSNESELSEDFQPVSQPVDSDTAARVLDLVFRAESRRILASLIRLVGDFQLAEDALQDAMAIALEHWPTEGVPANPRSWLISAGRFKAIDRQRREARFEYRGWGAEVGEPPAQTGGASAFDPLFMDQDVIEDDQLRLIFTCCHPALAEDARVPLTLRTVCGLTTDEIARLYLVSPETLAQRLVRAKRKIRDTRIPYQVPGPELLPERLDGVLNVIYLIFTEGYSASYGGVLLRTELCEEAIRLARLIANLLPNESEVKALPALMILHHARRGARTNSDGDIVLLEDQDRSLWNAGEIAQGLELLDRALALGGRGAYTLQAAIAALHSRAESSAATDWRQIAGLYDLLLRLRPSPVIELNRAVAISMIDGVEQALLLVDSLRGRGELKDYHLLPAVRADMLRRLGRWPEAATEYEAALALAKTDPERRFLSRRRADTRSHVSEQPAACESGATRGAI